MTQEQIKEETAKIRQGIKNGTMSPDELDLFYQELDRAAEKESNSK